MNLKSICVIGAGHLGHSLANQLVKLGHKVKATYRSHKKSNALYESIKFSLGDKFNSANLQAEIFIINVPPSQTDEHSLQNLRDHFKDSLFIYVSSTSVFNEDQLLVSEDTLAAPKSERSLRAYKQESVFKNDCIIRCSGLISDTRHPINSLIKKENTGANHPLNLIHIKDVINIISIVIDKEQFKSLIHATHINNLTKGEYYKKYAQTHQLGEIIYTNSPSKGKKVISNTLKDWSYQFIAPISSVDTVPDD